MLLSRVLRKMRRLVCFTLALVLLSLTLMEVPMATASRLRRRGYG